MLKQIRGVVVTTTDYQENSRILNIMCEEGMIGVIAKGCKNLKSNLRIIANKLVYADFMIYYNEDHLSTLKEGNIVNDFKNILSDLSLITYYTYITELTSQIMKQNSSSSSDIFKIYISTINKINEGLNPKVMMNILEIKCLDYLGVGINLSECCRCGSKKDIVTIDADAGGYICKKCYTNEIIYDEKVQKMLRMYYLVEIDTVKNLDIKDYIIEAIDHFLSSYYDRYTGLYIHSKKFLDKQIVI